MKSYGHITHKGKLFTITSEEFFHKQQTNMLRHPKYTTKLVEETFLGPAVCLLYKSSYGARDERKIIAWESEKFDKQTSRLHG